MRLFRLAAILMICLLAYSAVAVFAQEATEDANMTEEATPEATEDVSMTEEATPEATEDADMTDDTTPEATEDVEDTSADQSTDTAQSGVYIVQSGDNLYRIALRNGLTTQQLAEANGITNPSLIIVGQRITIPGLTGDHTTGEDNEPVNDEDNEPTSDTDSTETADGTTQSAYVVQSGDTLYRIAIRFNTSVTRLAELNRITDRNLIFTGQRLALDSSVGESSDTTTSDDSASSSPEEAISPNVQPIADIAFGTGIEVFLGQDVNALASQASQLGVDWVKIMVDWRTVEAEEGALNLTDIDAAVAAFSDGGFQIVLTVMGSPEWATPSATELALAQNAHIPPDDLSTYGDFVGTLAERYAGQVSAYEIWSEPNLRTRWMTANVTLRSDDRPDARLASVRYIDLLEAAYTAIKASDPDAIVVTAGLAPTGFNDFYNAIDTFVFFEALLDQGALNFSDAIGIRLDGFGNPPDASCCGTSDDDIAFNESYHFFFSDMLNNYREILDRSGGESTPLFVTHFGWGTAENASGTPRPIDQDYLTANTADLQAAYTIAAFEMGSERGDIGAMILSNLNGCAIGNTSACYYSVIGADGSARPLFGAIQNLDLMADSSGG